MKQLITVLLVLGIAVTGFSQDITPAVLNVKCDTLRKRHNSKAKPLLKARSQVNLNCELNTQTRTRAQAGHRIVLGDGFRAKEGSYFHGYIKKDYTSGKLSQLIDDRDMPYVVYPNPSTGTLYIATRFNTEQMVTVSITDLVGRTLYTTKQADRHLLTYQFDETLAKGMYFVRMQAGEEAWVERIIYR